MTATVTVKVGDSTFHTFGTKDFEMEIADNAFYLNKLLEGYLPIGYTDEGKDWYCSIKKRNGSFNYDPAQNHFTGYAKLFKEDAEHLQKLIENGWDITQQARAHYGLKS